MQLLMLAVCTHMHLSLTMCNMIQVAFSIQGSKNSLIGLFVRIHRNYWMQFNATATEDGQLVKEEPIKVKSLHYPLEGFTVSRCYDVMLLV